MNILFTICGRAGSKGLKNKNLLNLMNYPLVYYSLSVIDLYMKKNSDIGIDIALNSDSDELHAQCNEINMSINHIIRPEDLSGDITPKILVVRHSLNYMEVLKETKYDAVIDLDITSPIRRITDLENIIVKFSEFDSDVVFSVTKSRRNPYFNMVRKNEFNYYERVISSDYNTRQQSPSIFDMNASIYAYKPHFLRKAKGIFEGKCQISEMEDTAVLDIDSLEDLVLLDVIAGHLAITDSDWIKVIENIESLKKHSK
jgi:CMP-N,N'-diacetyllegionaminic acid synthase